mmetsp:Transcript_28616/g.60136  ORF Transcript_28616/g.60136 Transcript_28616/m.60136 type:complete len:330 (+) Transcript_28616:597-1586(+)
MCSDRVCCTTAAAQLLKLLHVRHDSASVPSPLALHTTEVALFFAGLLLCCQPGLPRPGAAIPNVAYADHDQLRERLWPACPRNPNVAKLARVPLSGQDHLDVPAHAACAAALLHPLVPAAGLRTRRAALALGQPRGRARRLHGLAGALPAAHRGGLPPPSLLAPRPDDIDPLADHDALLGHHVGRAQAAAWLRRARARRDVQLGAVENQAHLYCCPVRLHGGHDAARPLTLGVLPPPPGLSARHLWHLRLEWSFVLHRGLLEGVSQEVRGRRGGAARGDARGARGAGLRDGCARAEHGRAQHGRTKHGRAKPRARGCRDQDQVSVSKLR